MSWRSGCAPRPPVSPEAQPVEFDFAQADRLGEALRRAAEETGRNLETRRRSVDANLTDWQGGHRRSFDETRTKHETTLVSVDLAIMIARLRRSWDEAADAQLRTNRLASQTIPPPTP